MQRASVPPARGPSLLQQDGTLSFEPLRPEPPPSGRVQRARSALVAVLLVSLALVMWFTYDRLNDQLRRSVTGNLEVLLDGNVAAAHTWFESQELMVTTLVHSPSITVDAALALGSKGDLQRTAIESLDTRLTPLRTTGIISGHSLLDPELNVVTSAAWGLTDPGLVAAETWAKARSYGSAVSSPTFVEQAPTAAPRVFAYAIGAFGEPGEPTGYLVLSLDTGELSKLFHVTRWGDTGEVYAFDQEGRLLTESRFSDDLRRLGILPPNRASTLRLRVADPGPRVGTSTPRDRDPAAQPLTLMAKESTAGRNGVSLEGYRDYRGHEVVGAWRWLPEHRFGMAAEIDTREALEPVALIRRVSIMFVALVLLAALGFTLLGRWTLKLREKSMLTSQRLDQLARAIQPLSAALETEPGAVLLVNNHLEVVYANPSAVSLLGQDRPIIGMPVGVVFERLSPELRDALIEGQDTVVSQGEEDNDEETVLVSTRHLSIDGKPHALCMIRSVTKELRRREVEHWKKLIRVLSHELNNSLAPITSLVSSAKKLAEGGAADPQKLDKIFATITERTDHLRTFLESYGNLARLPRPARRNVGWKSFLDGLHSQFEFRLEGDVPPGSGYFDPIQMERVFVNLLKNARESGSPQNEIALRISTDPGGVTLDVLDRGAGMSPRVLAQAMLPFYSTKRTGTGVGLALSREIVEAHHGRITLANREGGGLQVSVWLPHRTEHLLSTSL